MSNFTVHPQLAQDSRSVCVLGVCEARLILDSRFPWLILVPQISNAAELHHLPLKTQQKVWQEVAKSAQSMENIFQPDKINIGMLGNMVPQLHIHVVARFKSDSAWPGPVWGCGRAERSAVLLDRWTQLLRVSLSA